MVEAIHPIALLESYGYHSSKGNQMKWKEESFWYKADFLGYESLAETACSKIIESSTLREYALTYSPVQIFFNNKMYRGAKSCNFLKENEELITLEHLIKSYVPLGLSKTLAAMSSVKNRIEYTVDMVKSYTGLDDFGEYLSNMLTVDAVFLNVDRHTNNIAFIYNSDTGKFSYTPYFDNGAALLSDTTSGDEIFAKPFSRDFDEQLDAAESLYGVSFKLEISVKDAVNPLFWMEEDALSLYTKKEIQRASGVIRESLRKYSYLKP